MPDSNGAQHYLVLHHNTDLEAPSDLSRYAVEKPIVIDAGSTAASAGGLSARVELHAAPPPELQQTLLQRIGNAPPIDRTVTWDDLDQLSPDAWWTGDATDRIEAPVGRHGANQELSIYFGVDKRDQRPCAHGVVAAMTGAGKTALFHTYIASLTTRYSPDELRLFLLDGKFGVSFRSYRRLPHADVVSLRTRPELARSVLVELLDEMERRNELFKSHRVEHFAAYRALNSPSGPLPRVLLIADEFQLLFEDDRDQEAANALLRLSEQARSAGIHLLLGSQHFAPAHMTNRNLVFANLHLRIAMQLTENDVNGTTDFGPNGRRLISATCDRPGRMVLNDRAGNDQENVAAKVAMLHDERRSELVGQLADRWERPQVQIVFDGDRQPDPLDNPMLGALLHADGWMPAPDLEDVARRPMLEGGLNIPDWLSAEHPVALFVGQAFSVRGQATLVLRRRQYEHVCVIGEQHSERIAVMAAAIACACVQLAPGALRMLVADRSIPETAWSHTLPAVAELARGAGFEVRFERDEEGVEAIVRSALEEVERRRGLGESERLAEPTTLVILAEPDRSESIRRIADDYGHQDSDAGLALQRLLDQGPAVGVHLISGWTTVGAAASVVGEKRLQAAFRHRVAMQMSEDDSFVMVRSPKATKLQPDGPRPVAALQFDGQNDRAVKFKPYTISLQERTSEDGGAERLGTFEEQMVTVFEVLRERPT